MAPTAAQTAMIEAFDELSERVEDLLDQYEGTAEETAKLRDIVRDLYVLLKDEREQRVASRIASEAGATEIAVRVTSWADRALAWLGRPVPMVLIGAASGKLLSVLATYLGVSL